MLRFTLALLFGLVAASAQTVPQTLAQSMTEAATQLASRTSSLLPRHATVSLELQNLSALPASEWSSFGTQIHAELRKAGIEIAAGPSAEPRVRITLSDSARGLLLVAEVASGDNRQIAMLPWSPPAAAEDKPRINLTKKLLWTQPEPILDVLLLDSNTQMLVLSASKVTTFHFDGGNWTPNATASLVLPRPVPRDPRGRIERTSDGFRAYLPGATCTGSLQPDLKITCAPGNETWPDAPVRWVTDRNLLESDAVKAPFYSIANGFFGGAEGWGSDIAAVEDPCAGAPAFIATGAATDHDEVRAYNSQATPASEALPLPGLVTALWPTETRGEVTLVVHNAQTGNYEASRLGLACSQ
jgi:hypothetical protein